MGRKTRYEILVTPELLDQVSKENIELMNEFLQYLTSIGRAKTTIEKYEGDIKIFFVWNLKNNKNKIFIDLEKRDIIRYQSYLITNLEESSSRIRSLKSALSSMSNFVENILDKEYPNFKSIINKVPAPPLQLVREKTILEDKQIENLLSTLIENKQYQKACLLALACASGARKSELLRFKVSYFVEKNIIYDSLYKTPEKIKTKGRGNGKFINKYVIVAKFKPYLDLWLQQRKELGIECDELFVIKKDNKWITLEISTIDSYAETFSKLLNINFYWHSLRHHFCSYLCKCNVPNSIIKDIIGWENEIMINTYNDIQTDDELGKYFDKDGVKQIKKTSLDDV